MSSAQKNDAGLVAAVVYEDLSLFEYGCAVEVFGLPRPELGAGWYRFTTVACTRGPLRGAGGIQIVADGDLKLFDEAKTIIVPGWSNVATPVPEDLCQALHRASERGTRVMSICTGAFVLAAAGLLNGKKATTHWRHAAELARRYPDIQVEPDVLYVDAGNILTSAGSIAGIDLCLHLIRRDHGARIANHVARRLVMPPHREGGQAQFIEEPISKHSGSALAPLLESVRGALQEEWTIPRLAAAAAMSPRSFQRHFFKTTGMPAGEWLLKERVACAQRLLEETDLSIDDVSEEVGFGAAATLRAHFRTRFFTSPGVYRQRFRAK
ncbi:Carnitine catabolism transcriptional activator [Agrobacterium sp. DSM 25558]|uniref:transcriptional regulator FtrA n=1 Tax=Agrobacterium sp. DSM 25558 TaxID=1907665 RepID=UPI0009724AB6|nr:transcriptional regulator FtrA [Agrobacterium sp. DSM 25558]SCX22435.1 Carnitine catabolism transcriptional activator [Agrobacterium sp. DSM 25558]